LLKHPTTHTQKQFKKSNFLHIFAACQSEMVGQINDFKNKQRRYNMLIIDVKDADSLDKALKKYKRKVERTGTIKELRKRQHYIKPSVRRRTELLKAAYKNEKFNLDK